MQRLASLKLLSKIPRNLTITTATPSRTPLFLPHPTPPHHPNPFFTHYTTFTHSKNGLFSREKVFPYRFFSNPVLSKQFLSNTLLKGHSKGLSGSNIGSVKALFTRRNFHSFNSFGSGWRSGYRRLTADNVVLALILSNVAVFMLWRVADHRFMIKNFTISVENFKSGRLHTLITHAFSHMDTFHLIGNMVGLYFFGSNIGRNFGPQYLLRLYLSGAVVGSVFHLVYNAFIAPSMKGRFIDFSKSPALGASGALNAIMLLDIFLFPKNTIYLEFFIPVPAILVGIFLIGKDVLRILEGDPEVSGAGHLGGAAVAAIAWARIRRGYF